MLLTRQRFLSNAIAASESCLVWVSTTRERFSRVKNRPIALQKSRPCKCGLSDHARERFLHRVAQKYNRHRKSHVLLTRRRFFPNAFAVSESRLVWVTTLRKRFSRIKNFRIALQKSRPCKCGFKPHLHGQLFCNAIRRFFMRENLSRKAVTHTRQDSLAAIAFGKNRCRVSNTCDLRCRLYFCATRRNNRSRPWSLTRGRFQRLESHKTKSRSCKQQIVCNLRVAQA